ncbi:unnamed protein product [marine sediment metagenome]|uniref:Uncharacterized protein n=1 Tax=marine sediment metagenome TaxID=412755 RepID=X1AQU6_9ZZZZ
MTIVDLMQDAIFELGIEISVEDATNLIRLVEEKITSTNKKSFQFSCSGCKSECESNIDLTNIACSCGGIWVKQEN